MKIVGFLALLGAGLSGCSDDLDHLVEVPDNTCSVPAKCDIEQDACVRAVLAITACERGDETPPLPEIRHVSQAMFAEELAQMSSEEAPDSWDAALRSMHLLAADAGSNEASLQETAEQVVAYFDPKTKSVSLIDETSGDQLTNMYTLSHELAHYLQDRAHDLLELQDSFGGSTDAQTAARALIEGDAVVSSTRVLARLEGHSPRAIDWQGYFEQLDDTLASAIAEASFPLGSALLTLPYEVGARYIAGVWDSYGRERVDRLFQGQVAPRTIGDWFAGYGAGKPQPSLEQPLDCMPPLDVEGFELLGADSFGATGVAAMLGAAAAAGSGRASDIWLASTIGLRADIVAGYGPSGEGGGPTLLIWRLRFATDGAAHAFADRLPWDDVGRRIFGSELVLAAGPGVTRDTLPTAVETCPTLGGLAAALTTMRSRAPTAWVHERAPVSIRPQFLD